MIVERSKHNCPLCKLPLALYRYGSDGIGLFCDRGPCMDVPGATALEILACEEGGLGQTEELAFADLERKFASAQKT